MSSNLKNSRRTFLKGSLLALGGISIVPRHVLGKGHLAPSDHLTKGIIGVGGMGRGHFNYAGTKTVAICDVDTRHIGIAQETLGKTLKLLLIIETSYNFLRLTLYTLLHPHIGMV
ncbi:hypothetical protein [Cyclobacterium qasimii]|uniref:Uncharacterized protein n=1 Tax=Cyclobacterium qasimii M12-11B TaxID=641524 RepID=S7VLM4_9BACT|nr:hypothetical protein [Cyclobacterium qasimii]EPR70821.1 hypothetical protein ADICYQ_0817 [Cyclobacterium qasimii M12-11B]